MKLLPVVNNNVIKFKKELRKLIKRRPYMSVHYNQFHVIYHYDRYRYFKNLFVQNLCRGIALTFIIAE